MEGKKIMFVEDSPTMRRIIHNSLKRLPFNEIIEAENGADALTKLQASPVDVILTDWNMPEMNGQELVQNLRSSAEWKDIPIIMITTRGMQEDVITAIQTGVNGYIVKPFTPELLKEKLDELVA
jgi:two-component system chemotaxis response regulator CheY